MGKNGQATASVHQRTLPYSVITMLFRHSPNGGALFSKGKPREGSSAWHGSMPVRPFKIHPPPPPHFVKLALGLPRTAQQHGSQGATHVQHHTPDPYCGTVGHLGMNLSRYVQPFRKTSMVKTVLKKRLPKKGGGWGGGVMQHPHGESPSDATALGRTCIKGYDSLF